MKFATLALLAVVSAVRVDCEAELEVDEGLDFE